MEWKEMERIILEYSSLPLFWSFNEVNGKSIPLFRRASLGRMELEWNEMKIIFLEYSSLPLVWKF